MSASAFSFPASLAGALVVAAAPAAAQDRWNTPDKPVHLAGGCVTAMIATAQRPAWSPAAQWAIASAPWVLKEALDATAGTTGWSWKDLAASVLGAAACVPLGRFAVGYARGQGAVMYRVEF